MKALKIAKMNASPSASCLLFLGALMLGLSACDGASSKGPTFSLSEQEVKKDPSDTGKKPGLGEQEKNEDSIWPSQILASTVIRCEYLREAEVTTNKMTSFSAAASPSAGARLNFFRDTQTDRMLSEIRSLVSTSKQSLVYTASRRVGSRSGLQHDEDSIFTSRMENIVRSADAQFWSKLPQKRLSTLRWSNQLPAWVDRQELQSVVAADGKSYVLMPEKDSGNEYKLYSPDANSLKAVSNKDLGLVEYTFPVALDAVTLSAVFQHPDSEKYTPRLKWVDAKTGAKIAIAPAQKNFDIEYFVAWDSNREAPAFWAWQDSASGKALVKVEKKGNSFALVKGSRFEASEALLATFNNEDVATKWLMVQNTQGRLELYGNSFELVESLPFPVGIRTLASIQKLSKQVWLVEGVTPQGLHQAYLFHQGLKEWKGPLSRSPCRNPTIQ